MFTNAQKRNWTLFLWGLCDFLQRLPLQSSEEEIQAILWHPLGLLKLMKRPLLHPIHCCWRRNNIIVRPTDQNISRLITYILLCRVTASLSSTAPLWNCHTTSAISLNIFIQTKFHYNMPICQVLLNNKISAVYAETNRNIQPPLKKIAFTPDMAGLIESLMFEKQTSKKPDIDKIIYYQRTKKTHKTTKMYDTWEKCKGVLHKGNKTLSKEKRQLHNISLRLISWIKSFWSIRTHSSPSNVQSKHCNKTTSRCTVRSLVGAQLSDRDTSLL